MSREQNQFGAWSCHVFQLLRALLQAVRGQLLLQIQRLCKLAAQAICCLGHCAQSFRKSPWRYVCKCGRERDSEENTVSWRSSAVLLCIFSSCCVCSPVLACFF